MTGNSDCALVGISTPSDEFNHFSKYLELRDDEGRPVWRIINAGQACAKCRAAGKAPECLHVQGNPPWKVSLPKALFFVCAVSVCLSVSLALFANMTAPMDIELSAEMKQKIHNLLNDRYAAAVPQKDESKISDMKYVMTEQEFNREMRGIVTSTRDFMYKRPWVQQLVQSEPYAFKKPIHVVWTSIDPGAGKSDYAMMSSANEDGKKVVRLVSDTHRLVPQRARSR